MNLIELKEFTQLSGIAKALAAHLQDTQLQAKHYVAAAWLAYQQGLLASQATVQAHIKAHEAPIKNLLKQEGMDGSAEFDSLAPPDVKIPLDEDIKGLIAHANVKGSDFLEFLGRLFLQSLRISALETVAYHEAGHAIVSLLLRPEVRVNRATIEPHGDAAGSVAFNESTVGSSQEDFLERLCIAIAGQTAQVKKFGASAADAGAVSDFSMATQVAWDYITAYGLDPQFGPVILDVLKNQGISSGWLFDEAQRRLQSVLKEAQAKTTVIIDTHWEKVVRVAELLLEKKTITEEELRAVVDL